MNHGATIERLRIAEAVSAAEMYVTCSANRGPSFGFRVWGALSFLTDAEANLLANEINDATAEVRHKWKRRYEDKAQQEFAQVRGLGL